MSSSDEKKLLGQRGAIREHIQKFERYNALQDKKFALRTISICQNEIKSILSDHRHWNSSFEDDWTPPRNWEKDCD
jgi:hypothetical protein